MSWPYQSNFYMQTYTFTFYRYGIAYFNLILFRNCLIRCVMFNILQSCPPTVNSRQPLINSVAGVTVSYRNMLRCYRSQLMLAEFKNDSALKEFTELSEQLDRGRQLQAAITIESAQKIAVSDNPKTGCSISSAEVSFWLVCVTVHQLTIARVIFT